MTTTQYDLVIYGATGFTGKLAVAYTHERYGKSTIRWAIAGRSRSKLSALAEEFGGCGIIVADSEDNSAVEAMVSQTRCIVSFAGPFSRYGSNIVEACASRGVDYCDITGEIDWVRSMITAHDATARKTGARIVPLCGHDSVPWDLTTMVLAHELKKTDPNERMSQVDFWDKIRSAPSGGTLETAIEIIGKGSPATKGAFDPLLRTPAGTASTSALKIGNISSPTLEADGSARGLFVMANVNASVVKRSNALCDYGSAVTYREGQAFSSIGKARSAALVLAALYVVLRVPLLHMAFRALGWLPKPGEGPSEAEMAKGFLRVTGRAQGERGGSATATLTFPTDPGYKDTARMAIEAGLALALEGGRCARAGGVLTPAACQGEVLLERLLETGCTLQVGSGNEARPAAAA